MTHPAGQVVCQFVLNGLNFEKAVEDTMVVLADLKNVRGEEHADYLKRVAAEIAGMQVAVDIEALKGGAVELTARVVA